MYFVDGPCGSAKTYAAVRYAHQLARLGKKVLFVQSSIFLINQTVNDLASLTPEVRFRAIHGETSDRVIADTIEHFKHTTLDGEILFITHSALMLLPYCHRRQDWHVIVDEIPQADWCAEFNVPRTHRLITDCFTVDAEAANLADNRYVRAVPKDHTVLEQMARNKDRDQVWDIFQWFANVLISPHWSAYVLDDQYINLISGVGKKRKLLAFAHLKPSLLDGFATATIMGACFKNSVLYQLWAAAGVEFRPHRAITKRLRYAEHSNGELLTIRHATEEDWSKNFRDKAIGGAAPATVQDRVVQRVSETFSGVEFVWMANKDAPNDIFKGRGYRLPNSPYGLNPYQHIHHAVILSALNPPPAHFAFLDALGFDSREVKRAGYWQACYQAAMRISLRNPDDTNPKTVIVMDRATAEWMASMFPGCTVAPLDGMGDMPIKGKPGRPRQHDCNADRKRANRDQFRSETRMALDLIAGGERAARHCSPAVAELRKQMSEFGFGKDTALSTTGRADLNAMGGTIFASVYHAEPLDLYPLDDIETFVSGLRWWHQFEYGRKEANGLISPAIFDATLSDETKRGLANIRAVWGIWLDNDGGDLTHQEFARLFPRLRMVIFNSYNSTRDKPRWRVFIPTTVAMPIAAHRAIGEQIMRTLNRDGYWSKKQLDADARIKSRKHHGFDMGKLTPASLFYLPCQAANPADSFFIDHNSASRQPLDPYVWAGYAANHHHRPLSEPVVEPAAQPMPEIPPTKCPKLRRFREMMAAEEAAKNQNDREQRQATAIDRWHQTPSKKGNESFFQLGVDLLGSGMSMADIHPSLRDQAHHARHPDQRRKQVKYIMRTLRRWSRQPTPESEAVRPERRENQLHDCETILVENRYAIAWHRDPGSGGGNERNGHQVHQPRPDRG